MAAKYQGHGNHWEPFADVSGETAAEFLGSEMKVAKHLGAWPCVDVVNESSVAEKVHVLRKGGERVVGQYLAVSESKSRQLHLFSAYPVLLDGAVSEARIDRVEPWPYEIEGWIDCAVCEENLGVTFFDTMFFTGSARLKPGAKVRVSFAGLAYRLQPIQTRTVFISEGPFWEARREEALKAGESPEEAARPVEIDMTQAAVYVPRGDQYPDEAEFQGVIEAIDRLEHLGVGVYRLEMVVSRPECHDWRLAVYASDRVLQDGYVPKVGDAVEGILWLQGRVLDD